MTCNQSEGIIRTPYHQVMSPNPEFADIVKIFFSLSGS